MAAGTTVKVTTVDGLVDLKIPGGTQPGTTLVMSKRGVPRLGASNSRGDHQVLHPSVSATGYLREGSNEQSSTRMASISHFFCLGSRLKASYWHMQCRQHLVSMWRNHTSMSCAQCDSNVEVVVSTLRCVLLLLQVHVRVEIPSKLSNDERKIVEELKEIQSQKPAKKKGFSLF